MKVALVLAGKLKKGENVENHPPKVAFKPGPDSLVIEYKWTADCIPFIFPKSATDVKMDKKSKEILGLKG